MNKLDEILNWQTILLAKEGVLQNVSGTKKINITEEMLNEARTKAKQAILDYFSSEVIGELEKVERAIKLCEEMYGRGGCGAIYDTLREQLKLNLNP